MPTILLLNIEMKLFSSEVLQYVYGYDILTKKWISNGISERYIKC